jgi:hypothetical protein
MTHKIKAYPCVVVSFHLLEINNGYKSATIEEEHEASLFLSYQHTFHLSAAF